MSAAAVARSLGAAPNLAVTHPPVASSQFIGVMTGTSLDGLDAVLADFSSFSGFSHFSDAQPRVLGAVSLPYPAALRAEMLALQAGSNGLGVNELHRSRVAGIALSALHSQAVAQLLLATGRSASDIAAIGVHGQTVRHAPHGAQGDAAAYTVQLIEPARIAEATGCTVVSDVRSRDIAAGGQGAPLVPAFHAALCAALPKPLALVNIGGFANVSLLHADGTVQGFDTGPGNVLMDAWAQQHLGQPYDADGAWAAAGQVQTDLLNRLLAHPYFSQTLPKSTGREAFDLNWVSACMAGLSAAPAAVQATLCALTARTVAQAIAQHQNGCQGLYVCGGGALNQHLMALLQAQLSCPVRSTAALGVAPQQMEALAFGWLARQCLCGLAGNVPSVTGARGLRVLGMITPA
jgi:anhydro-N-acetylmuramic acid kinase